MNKQLIEDKMRIGKYEIGFFKGSKYKKIALAFLILFLIAMAIKVATVASCTNCLYGGW